MTILSSISADTELKTGINLVRFVVQCVGKKSIADKFLCRPRAVVCQVTVSEHLQFIFIICQSRVFFSVIMPGKYCLRRVEGKAF
jgi:hypothetical protein